MKILISVLVILSLTACVPQSKTNSPKTTGSGSSGSLSTTNAFTPTNTNSGMLQEEVGSGSGTGEVVVVPTPEPTPSALPESCGQLYLLKSGTVMFIDEDEHYRIIDPITYNAEQVVNNITFPNDAFNACVHGNLGSTYGFTTIQAEYIQLSDGIINPMRATKKSSYSFEICGSIMYKQDIGQSVTWIQMKVGQSYKIIDDPTNTVKNYLDAHGNTEGCLYNNAGFTSNTYVTFKQYFKPLAFELGW